VLDVDTPCSQVSCVGGFRVWACVRACVRAWMHGCVRACVQPCTRQRMRAAVVSERLCRGMLLLLLLLL
jgi:hypothetical protein